MKVECSYCEGLGMNPLYEPVEKCPECNGEIKVKWKWWLNLLNKKCIIIERMLEKAKRSKNN